jgi:opacity protein-like surface antigen
MGRSKISALIGGALFFLPAANALAADIPNIPAPPVQIGGGWYLKGYIGMANQGFKGLDHPDFSTPAFFEFLDKGNFDAVPLFGVGLGYQYSDHVRFDVTGEYRGASSFEALDRYDTFNNPPLFTGTPGTDWGGNHYTAKKNEWLFLANGYYDFSPWRGITPYVGAGIGASYNTITDFLDENTAVNGGGWAPSGSKLSLAWALHAGASVQVTNSMSIDFGYSFVSLGDAQTGPFQNLIPTLGCIANVPPTCVPMKFKGLYSNDFKIGVRWALGQPAQQSYYPPVVKY